LDVMVGKFASATAASLNIRHLFSS
jgi:hypothetical protein